MSSQKIKKKKACCHHLLPSRHQVICGHQKALVDWPGLASSSNPGSGPPFDPVDLPGPFIHGGIGAVGKAMVPHWALLPLVPPSFKQAPGGPQKAILVRAGDKATLSCETDSLPEAAVTWFKDQQPLALGQRIQGLQGGQTLEILDSQVSGREQSGQWTQHLLTLEA